MVEPDTGALPWPSDKSYGSRFKAIDERLERSFTLSEYQGTSVEDLGVLRYRLAKLAIAAEDIRRAIRIVEEGTYGDEEVAEALVELRAACTEVEESFRDADPRIIAMLNFIDR